MAAIPTLGEEDARRPNRERENLLGERTRIVNRMKASLIRFGVRNFKPTLRKAPERLEALRTPEGGPLPPNSFAELRRDMARLRFVMDQIREIEETRLQRLEHNPKEGSHAMVRLLARVIGVGIEHARARDIVARLAGSKSGRSLRRSHRLSRRKRQEATGKRSRQGWECPRPARHDTTRLAVPHVPKEQRSGPMVSIGDQ